MESGDLGGIFGRFGALMGARRVGAVGYDLVSGGCGWGKWKNCSYASFDRGLWDFTAAVERLNGEWQFGWYFWPFWGSEGGPQGRRCVI